MSFSLKKIVYHPIFALVIVIIAFVLASASIFPIKVQQMGSGEFWIERVIPILYWIGAAVIVSVIFLMMQHLGDKRFRAVFVFSSILLMICIRMVFSTIFTTVPAYEPDATRYMTVVISWVQSGVNFGISGFYQHDFPLSFLTAFAFVKLGVSIETFFRIAPLFIYAFELVLLYLIVGEIIPDDKRYAAVAVFLLSISSLAGWVTVFYCPDLFGSLFFFVSLYLSIRFAKKGEVNIKALSPVLVSIFLLVLSHHLSILYFVLTLAGLSLSCWFFKTPQIRGKPIKPISFLILAAFTYLLWLSWGTLLYANFFTTYLYIQGFGLGGGVVTLAANAPLIVNAEFAVYPVLILLLSMLGLFELLKVRSLRDLFKLRSKFRNARKNQNMLLVYSVGFVFILLFVPLSLVVFPIAQVPRIVEVFCVGLYPVASLTMLKFGGANTSKKTRVLILMLIIFVTLVDIHRYYNDEQRRVLLGT